MYCYTSVTPLLSQPIEGNISNSIATEWYRLLCYIEYLNYTINDEQISISRISTGYLLDLYSEANVSHSCSPQRQARGVER